MKHTGKNMILRADIKDFFPSIEKSRVKKVFQVRLKCSAEVADVLSVICTYKDRLPKGAPTSTIIANFVIEHMAYRLHELAKNHEAEYTQFVDDITISGPRFISSLKLTAVRIIEEEGFISHPDKLCSVSREKEQIVTGVRVNEGKDVPSKKITDVQNQLKRLKGESDKGLSISEQTIRRLEGKIQYIGQLNKGAGKYLRRKLKSIQSVDKKKNA